jgi:1-acylglycerone phosphate reductase
LELEPYDVKVMVVVTGGVQSRIARTDRVLREGSLYLEIDDEFQRKVKHNQEGAMPAQVYAKDVADAALKKSPKKWLLWGNKAFLIWFVRNWLGTWVFDLLILGWFGLDRLKRLVREKAKI